jgi:two-component system, NarL family, invasion response regulator UvrY
MCSKRVKLNISNKVPVDEVSLLMNGNKEAIRVLLADGNPTFLHIAADVFRLYPELALVGTASTPSQTLALAQELCPQVILIDLNLPGLLNSKLIARLRHLLPQVGIIALNLLDAKGIYYQMALDIGADDLVDKGALVTNLLPAIQRVIGQKKVGEPDFSPNEAGK